MYLDIDWKDIAEGHESRSSFTAATIKVAFNFFLASLEDRYEELRNDHEYRNSVMALPDEMVEVANARDFFVSMAEQGASYDDLHEAGGDVYLDQGSVISLIPLSTALNELSTYTHTDFH